jgi:hypothetical protein
MEKLTLSKISLADLKRFVTLQEGTVALHPWTQIDSISLTDNELRQVQDLKSRLSNCDTHLMNEATIWARAIYPLLLLAEQEPIQAWAEVPLQTQYAQFEIEGVADGVLGKTVAGRVESPYLIVVEAKKGVESQNPVFQLYGQLLAGAHLNWENDHQATQEIFGCYTIADTWKLVRAEIKEIETDMPTMRLEYSKEYTEKYDAEILLKILKLIVVKYIKKINSIK